MTRSPARPMSPHRLAQTTRDTNAVYDREGEYVWSALNEHCRKVPANDRFTGPARHVRIEPRIDWTAVAAIVLAAFCIGYFGWQFVRSAF